MDDSRPTVLTFAERFRRFRANRFGNAAVGAVVVAAVAIGVTQLMMLAGFG